MIDKFDYAEPSCALCGGKEFYNPKKDAPLGRIPIGRVLDKVDSLFDKNDYAEAGRLLEYWKNEAVQLNDKQGELAITSELVGYYRKQNDKIKGLEVISRALSLIEELSQGEMASGATILINCATAYKAFDMVEQSLPLFIRAEKIYKKVLKDGDSRFGGLYNNMALTFSGLKKFEDAEKAYFIALSVMEKAERGETECAITYINLAHLYENMGKTDQIKPCMEKAYALLKSENLPHDGYYAFVLEKCAPSFEYFGFTEQNEQMLKESKKIYERA